jgi:hypothetical protein
MPRAKKRTRKKTHTPSLFGKTYLTRFTRIQKYSAVIFFCVLILFGAGFYHSTQSYTHVPLPDDRPHRIDTYFSERAMPLSGYGDRFVAVADACDMDWRLLPAIAIRESSGGKRMQYNNPFGWGGANIPFESIDQAIEEVGKNLCGNNPRTARWYSTPSIEKKLYYYNGTVIPSYPKEVMWIMKQF